MISITSETKLKPGLINKVKSILYKDKGLWDFTVNDPKQLAYYLSGLELAKRLSGYGASDDLYKTIVAISSEHMGIDQKEVMQFTESRVLYEKFSEIDLSAEVVDKIINKELNPEIITAQDAKKVVNGFLKYLRYQSKRGVVVKLFWS
jgi:hypothetical protein